MASQMYGGLMYFELESCKCTKENARGCVFCYRRY